MRLFLSIVAVAAGAALILGQASHISELKDAERRRDSAQPQDPFGVLAKQIERGEVQLDYGAEG
jgi:hypothetical protein